MIFLLLAFWLQQPIDVWLCPIHPDVQLAAPGICSMCSRPLEQRTLSYAWVCPMHNHVQGENGGRCPVCGMALVQTTMEVAWICPRHPDTIQRKPGRCAIDGQPLEEKRIAMAHGDHNPRHNGIFFMAPDAFHHLEGTLETPGTFRLYLYDNFTHPLDARQFRARVFDRRMEPSNGGEYLEAKLAESQSLPIELVVYVQFEDQGREEQFDFIFYAPALQGFTELIIPEQPADIIEAILQRNARIHQLMQQGAWTELFIPALEAKDLALALSAKAGPAVRVPVKTIVRAAWLLDVYGDRGNKLKVQSAYEVFVAGIQQLRRSYGR